MNRIDPKSLIIINGLPPVVDGSCKVSFDTEFFNMEKKRLHRQHGDFAFLGCTFDGVKVYYITDQDEVEEFLRRIDAGVWIGHNLKFDINQLRRYAHIAPRKKIWDTMLIEQIMYSGYYDTFSLADLARRRLDIYLEKGVRSQFSGGGEMVQDDLEVAPSPSGGQTGHELEMSREMLEYSCVDVVATWQVYQDQRAEIDDNDLNIWKEIERPFLWTILSMSGVKMDSDKWLTLAQNNADCAKEIQDKYGHWETVELKGEPTRTKKTSKDVFVGLNLNSPMQVKAHFATLGYKLKSTDAEALEKLKDECEFAQDMLKYRTYAKRASTYGKKFIDDYVEADGRIYGDIFQMGAQTGRCSSRSPNMQNQPHDKEYRECFVAGEGNVVIVADWGSQEPRVAAYLSQDERLIEILNSDKKLYIEIARDVLGKTITKQSPEYSHIKSTVLGIFYGMSAQGLSKRIGVPEEEAGIMIKNILATYPGIKDYIDRQYQAKDYVQSIYGRKIWLNKYSNGWERGALNYPIQGSAADAMKIAAYRFVEACDEEIYQHSPLRLLVHDECVIECKEKDAEWMIQTLEKIMLEVAEEMHDGIKGAIEISKGSSWACKS